MKARGSLFVERRHSSHNSCPTADPHRDILADLPVSQVTHPSSLDSPEVTPSPPTPTSSASSFARFPHLPNLSPSALLGHHLTETILSTHIPSIPTGASATRVADAAKLMLSNLESPPVRLHSQLREQHPRRSLVSMYPPKPLVPGASRAQEHGV
jgi:hypothetical protein